MKRKIILLLGATVLSIGMLTGCADDTQSQGETNVTTSRETTTVQNVTTQNSAVQDTTIQDTTVQDTTVDETTSANVAESIISEEEAKNIALKDAGVNETDVTNIRVSRDIDDGRQEYEVDFFVGSKEYEYTISAEDGKILDKDLDIEDDF